MTHILHVPLGLSSSNIYKKATTNDNNIKWQIHILRSIYKFCTKIIFVKRNKFYLYCKIWWYIIYFNIKDTEGEKHFTFLHEILHIMIIFYKIIKYHFVHNIRNSIFNYIKCLHFCMIIHVIIYGLSQLSIAFNIIYFSLTYKFL